MKFVLTLFLMPWFSIATGQNPIGLPNIVNYPNDVYGAGTENRDITQDQNGIMYFANLEGLLTFDGAFWKLYGLPNKSTVRCLAIGEDNKVYVGGQGDFGYFSPNAGGKLVFNSLKPLLPTENYSFTNVGHIVPFGSNIFFRSREKIFEYRRNTITTYPAPSEWSFLGVANNMLIAQDLKVGLMKYSNGLWKSLVNSSHLPSGFSVSSIFSIGTDSLFVTTVNSGFFVLHDNQLLPFKFNGINPFKNQRILTAKPVGADRILVGTNLNGCYIINKKGEILQNLSRKEGLQLNNILSVFQDYDNNVWLGLDDGIDFIAYNSAIKHIYPEKLNEGKGFTSLIYKNNLYIGTSNGLYTVPVKDQKDLSLVDHDFTYIPDTRGANLNLSEINGELLLGHQDGAYKISNDRAIPINLSNGYLCFLPFSNVLPSKIVIAGSDLGLRLLEWQNDHFTFKKNIPGFAEYSQFVEIDNNKVIWISNPYRGVYKVKMDTNEKTQVKLYTEKNGLPTTVKNQLFKIQNQIVVATEKGIYQYDSDRDRFMPSTFFANFFGNRNIRYLKEDLYGNIWFVEDKNLGVIDFSRKIPKIIYFPEISGKMVGDRENIYPYDSLNILIGAEKGFYHINFEEYKKKCYDLNVQIRSVKVFGEKQNKLFSGYYGQVNQRIVQPADAVPTIDNDQNSLHFEFSAPAYGQQSIVQYSYYLKGFDQNWSEWSKKTEKDYTNLSPGKYSFQVKAMNNLGKESTVNTYLFQILPPWYRTVWAYAFYSITIISLFYFLIRWLVKLFDRQQKKHEEEQKRLTYLHDLELEKSEKEIVKLRNEKLEAEINLKNIDLAATAMHLVQKGELLGTIKDVMRRMKKSVNGNTDTNEFKKIIRILNEENKVDKDWEHFSQHFDQVHNNFIGNFKSAYPNLTAHELKLCAYLRMNLSSKEIAQLDGISVRGVEMSRYRLRKKIKLSSEINLMDYILTF